MNLSHSRSTLAVSREQMDHVDWCTVQYSYLFDLQEAH